MDSETDRRLSELFPSGRPTRWVTRERPKIDRLACPWLIRRFLDAEAEILYVPTPAVFEVAEREGAIAFDLPGGLFSHVGELCSFDAFLTHFGLTNAGLERLALIVRGADTDRHDLAPEAAGLHAVSLGLSLTFTDDQALLDQGLVLYDALYAWSLNPNRERHAWRPADL